MAKAVNPVGKTPGEMDEQELAAHEESIRLKNEDLERMKEERRIKHARMERINPAEQDEYVLTPQEVEDIEKDLPEEFDEKDIEKELKKRNIDVADRKAKAKQEREDYKKMIDEQAKKENA